MHIGFAGARFELLAYSRSREMDGKTVWVDEDASGERVQLMDPIIVPIKSMKTEYLQMQLHAENLK